MARIARPIAAPGPSGSCGGSGGGITRRAASRLLAASALGTLAAPAIVSAQSPSARVVVIGGGPAGASTARMLRLAAPEVSVTLVEPKTVYASCFFSNLVLGGLIPFSAIEHGFDALRADPSLTLIHATAEALDAAAGEVRLDTGQRLAFDRLVVAPGIGFDDSQIEGYALAMADGPLPHAYQAGPQTKALMAQITGMRQGGTFVMAAPPYPYRCPPGPYERVSMVAHHFKQHNPTAKILILDPKTHFSKQPLFRDAWDYHYPGMVDWIPGDFGGLVVALDPATLTLTTDTGDDYQADVLNLIPAQTAGPIAASFGLTDDSGWCPVNPSTLESTQVPGVHVVGDAAIMGPLPKSAYAAHTQAQVAAGAIAHGLGYGQPPEILFQNACWSVVAGNDAIKLGADYIVQDGEVVQGEGFISEVGESAETRAEVKAEAEAWYRGISAAIWG